MIRNLIATSQVKLEEQSNIFFPPTPDEVYQNLKGPLSALRQFLATESPLKMIKNTFYFT